MEGAKRQLTRRYPLPIMRGNREISRGEYSCCDQTSSAERDDETSRMWKAPERDAVVLEASQYGSI